ncbi:hypothetical protein JHK85_002976 [Glycine max]|nr:hypothetical protein JHK85_002976 [Glycine max]
MDMIIQNPGDSLYNMHNIFGNKRGQVLKLPRIIPKHIPDFEKASDDSIEALVSDYVAYPEKEQIPPKFNRPVYIDEMIKETHVNTWVDKRSEQTYLKVPSGSKARILGLGRICIGIMKRKRELVATLVRKGDEDKVVVDIGAMALV